jgi:plasmid maintenance system antidote protein VapI
MAPIERGSAHSRAALRLAAYFKTTAEFWMNLQARYDLEVARDSRGIKAIAKIRPYKAA